MTTTTATAIPLPPIIDVATDYDGLTAAFHELLVHSYDSAVGERSRKLASDPNTANAEQLQASLSDRYQLSPGYYDRIHYLLRLEMMVGIGVRFSLDDLNMAEVQGLQLLREERTKFHSEHPACPRCGVLNDRFAMRCRGCRAEFQVRSRRDR